MNTQFQPDRFRNFMMPLFAMVVAIPLLAACGGGDTDSAEVSADTPAAQEQSDRTSDAEQHEEEERNVERRPRLQHQ